ncbi:cache domain-containing protein [Salipiger sp. PrR002]|uniref:sensor histidine kinase n=1 Tax=Salipiger sp. PrR002 TaxID=2706489 RepID=UPI0013BE6D64|nr:cache domain-containing protein [Salipiger sp. PrR002]NDW00500.1 HAMP domain-containing protein [Salipiger sp. PrR002]NDW56458.1 HAMP domain-containing protein [Salipiger sp. PrR004]
MISVRLRLLILALAPLVVLMPLLLLLGMTRWTGDYDDLLAANVQSDLRIAEQYLSQLMARTGDELGGVAGSVAFAEAFDNGGPNREFLLAKRAELRLDFLYYLPMGAVAQASARWPVIAEAQRGRSRTAIDIFPPEALAALPRNLDARARIDLIETEAAVPTDRLVEDRGMVVHSASPVRLPGHEGVLVGGILLNSNLGFIDAINALVYRNPLTGGTRQGTATLFLDDVRISTNVRLFEDVRALGTRVSAVVRNAVLDEGQTWLARAFVVNDWYISGYLPLSDSFGNRVGMLYVGFLEAPFAEAKRKAYLWMMAAFAGVLLLSAPVFLWMAKGIFAPLEKMTATMRRVARGNLAARIGPVGRDEIGQVAAHLDGLLDQVQDRDLKLRAWAEELEDRVDRRTAELRDANAKLEDTYRQLVMSEKLASIGEITAGVAHEINNPMAVIQGNVEVIRMELAEAAAPVETELTLIERQVMRMQAIVGKLLKFARPSEFSDCGEGVDLRPVVEDSLLLADHALGKGAIEVHSDLPSLPLVAIDAGEMQQVVINLILNAAQAMGSEGQLALALREEMRDGVAGVALEVRDSGPGIAEENLGALFDPFFTTRRGEGTGLGLSISQSIVQRAGGLITAANAEGGGAVFTVWLPQVG